MRRPLLGLVGAVCVAALVTTTAPAQSATSIQSGRSATSTRSDGDRTSARAAQLPSLKVTRVAGGLDQPWDVANIGGGRFLVTERESRRLLRVYQGKVRAVTFQSGAFFSASETGLMSLAVDPSFASNRRFYTCAGSLASGRRDVRVLAWTLDAAATRATAVRTLVNGLPSTSGRHGGCRLLITSDGALVVGTGDAAVGTNPRDLTSLGGKTLRLNRMTGAPWPSNPFITSGNARTRYVYTYGHRNVQGLAQRPDGTVWSAEHGPDRDDEVNRLVAGGDYGWNPVPGYDESVPMTDQRLPGTQLEARWRSGSPTLATSGITWIRGARYGALEGSLAVAALKGSRLMFQSYDAAGTWTRTRVPGNLRAYGRQRSVTQLPNGGDLLITTANGDRKDVVLRVTPSLR